MKWKKNLIRKLLSISSCGFLAAITISCNAGCILCNDITSFALKAGKHWVVSVQSQQIWKLPTVLLNILSHWVVSQLWWRSTKPACILSSQSLLQDSGLGLICRQHLSSGIMCLRNRGQHLNYKQRAQGASAINLDAHVFPLALQGFFQSSYSWKDWR